MTLKILKLPVESQLRILASITIVAIGLIYAFVRPIWVMNFTAIASGIICISGGCFYFALNPKSIFVYDRNKKSKTFATPRPRRVLLQRILRLATIAFSCLLFYVLTLPMLMDIFGFLRQGAAYFPEIEGRVISVDEGIARNLGALHEPVSIETGVGKDPVIYYSDLFAPHGNVGEVYRFHIAPNSELILDAEKI